VVSLCTVFIAVTAPAADKKPNILFIMGPFSRNNPNLKKD
jgi:hypothetical protein